MSDRAVMLDEPIASASTLTCVTGEIAGVVIVPGHGVIYATKWYRRPSARGTLPAILALRAAQRWLASHPEASADGLTADGPPRHADPDRSGEP